MTVRAGREYPSAVRAALLHEIGGEPALGDAPEPAAGDGAVAELTAAALNPVDVTIATGVYYGGTPDLPYVVGREGVGRAVEGDRWPAGTLVYTIQSPSGTLAERFATGALAWEVPDADPAVIAALGIAGITGWMAVERRARLRPDERVLVLADQPRLTNLAAVVTAVPGIRIDLRGREQPDAVVVPKRPHGHPAQRGERSDRE